MRIAIIGTGLSGLATGWFLLNNSPPRQLTLTFFDPLGIGGGTSGMAAGLMHPYAGAAAKLNPNGLEGYQATCKLLDVASEKIGRAVASDHGLLRLATTDRQKSEYRLTAERYDNIIWCEAEEAVQKIPGLSFHPGIFIKNSVTVDCPLYLEGLWKACEEKGAIFEKSSVNSLDELKDFDQIVLATGASVNTLLPFLLPITQVKGQVIELTWPKNLDPLPFALNSHAYILVDKKKILVLLGRPMSAVLNQCCPIRIMLHKISCPRLSLYYQHYKKLLLWVARRGFVHRLRITCLSYKKSAQIVG